MKSYIVDALGKNGESIPISLNASIVYEEDREVATICFFHDMRETLRMKKPRYRSSSLEKWHLLENWQQALHTSWINR